MDCIDFGPAHNPAFNLAREEYLFTRLATSGDGLLLYVNTDAVVIGRNQVPWAEVAVTTLARAGVPLVRRVSGGGAVYHDAGNLNFSILLKAASPGLPPAATILQPVVRALTSMGLPARLSQRNAIFVGRYKVSGTAQYMTAGRIMTHGTLLVHADLKRLHRCLRPDPACRVHSRGRPSVPSPVANLADFRPDISMAALRQSLRQAFAETYGPLGVGAIDPEDEQAARRLAAGKYRRWAWNVGRTPQCTLEWEGDFKSETCRCRLHAQRGVITAVEVTGPSGSQARRQQWAEGWLRGRRLGDSSWTHGENGAVASTVDAVAFGRWLQGRLPGPLPVP